jgi:transcriptional regulator with XRE-family HTH domain
MPRRATPLSPDDGPQARFALELRHLRDDAGFDAKTIHAIAAENNMPRSTLHAALRGERIPTVPVLAALVRAWGGNEAEWMRKRTRIEDEIERLRLLETDSIRHEYRREVLDLRRHSRDAGVNSLSPEEACEVKIRLLESLLAADLVDDEQYRDVLENLLRGTVRAKPLALPPGRPQRVPRNDEDPFADVNWNELLEELKTRNDMAPTWDLLRERAGAPTIRDIAGSVGAGQTAVSLVLRGSRGDLKLLTNVFAYLVGRLESYQAQQAPRDLPDE